MDKIKALFNDKLAQVSAVVGVVLAAAPHALAVTPTYTMDATVTASVTDLLQSLVQTVFSIIPTALGIVGTLMITLFGIRWLIGLVRGNMHG